LLESQANPMARSKKGETVFEILLNNSQKFDLLELFSKNININDDPQIFKVFIQNLGNKKYRELLKSQLFKNHKPNLTTLNSFNQEGLAPIHLIVKYLGSLSDHLKQWIKTMLQVYVVLNKWKEVDAKITNLSIYEEQEEI